MASDARPTRADAGEAIWTDNEFIQAHKCEALEAPASDARVLGEPDHGAVDRPHGHHRIGRAR